MGLREAHKLALCHFSNVGPNLSPQLLSCPSSASTGSQTSSDFCSVLTLQAQEILTTSSQISRPSKSAPRVLAEVILPQTEGTGKEGKPGSPTELLRYSEISDHGENSVPVILGEATPGCGEMSGVRRESVT